MNDSNRNLTAAIQIVVTLFASFGAVLGDFLPDQIEAKSYIYGTAQFACLLLFLLIKITIIKNTTPVIVMRWKIFAMTMSVSFIVVSFLYYCHGRDHLKSIQIGNEKRNMISGVLTQESKALCKDPLFISDNPRKLPCEEALLEIGNETHLIWTKDSVQRNTDIFVFLYILMIGTLSAALFSLIEIFPIPKGKDTR